MTQSDKQSPRVDEDRYISDIDPTPEEIEQGLKKLKGRDLVGRTGDALSSATGIAAGAASAGAIAGAAGATTVLGSTTLGSLLGGVFVATTPVGWVIGTAALAGVAGYGIAKLVRSGERQDGIRSRMADKLRHRINARRRVTSDDAALLELKSLLDTAVKERLISHDQAQQMLSLVGRGSLPAEQALVRVVELVQSAKR